MRTHQKPSNHKRLLLNEGLADTRKVEQTKTKINNKKKIHRKKINQKIVMRRPMT